MQKITQSKQGQTIVEYALVASLIAAAVVAMSTYVLRAVQSTHTMITEESRNE